MFLGALTNLYTIGVVIVIVWSWVALISQAVARRTGWDCAVPDPDDALWARFGRFLLSRGLFGGAKVPADAKSRQYHG